MNRNGLTAAACAAAVFPWLSASGCSGAVSSPLLGNDAGSEGGSGSTSGGVSTSTSSGNSGSSGSGSGSGSSGSGTSGSSSGTSGSSSGTTSGSSSGVGSSTSSGSSSGSSAGDGYAVFGQCSSGSQCASPSYAVTAAFYPYSADPCLNTLTFGSCKYFSCSSPSVAPVSAGTISVYPQALQVAFDATNHDYQLTGTGTGFSAGESLSFAASGAVVLPFMGTVVAPGPATLLTPAEGSMFTIPTQTDLLVSWKGGPPAPGSGIEMLFEGAYPDDSRYFQCTWDASAAQGTVPAQLLHYFAGQTNAFVEYGFSRSTVVQAAGYSVTLSAVQYGAGLATFQ